ncbi:MAG: oxidoreductase FAD/NAD(P)-binding domain protein [Humibacillus sp.]|nr:oxidoreductase FAD/NAD(P)-binding domain protein [Humibacillus sp.]
MRIAVLDDYQGVALTSADWSPVLGRTGPDGEPCIVNVFRDHVGDPRALVERLLPYAAVVVMRERAPLPAEVLRALPGLRLVVTTGRRNASIDLEAAAAAGITVCGTESRGSAPAELTWALILGLARHLVPEAGAMHRGGWQSTVGADLAGRTLGLLGLGRIGAQVAAVGRAFGMEVTAWSPHLTPERAEAAGARAVGLDELLTGADVVSVHLVLGETTRGLIGPRELALLRPHALLVNTSRGPIVDEAALLAALEAGRLGGVGLDVYDQEPLPVDDPLRTAPRTLLTPHLGYVTEGTYTTFFTGVVEDLVAHLDGAPMRVLDRARDRARDHADNRAPSTGCLTRRPTGYVSRITVRASRRRHRRREDGCMAPLRVLRRMASILTTPLTPEDVIGLVNPLSSARQLRGIVTRVERETADSTSIHFRPGKGWNPHVAGQWARIGVEVDGVRHWRSYSLSAAGGDDPAITVTALGVVSSTLARETKVGDILFLDTPQGDFVLPEHPRPLLMLTAGSGLTPVMSMIRTLVPRRPDADVVLVHSARTPADALFHDELLELEDQFPGLTVRHWFTRETDGTGEAPRRLDLTTPADLDVLCPDWRHRAAYACGPTDFLDAATALWASDGDHGTDATGGSLTIERFAPVLLEGAGGEGGLLTFEKSDREVEAPGDVTLLDAGEGCGVVMPSGCRMGICRSCLVPLVAGRVRDLRTGEVHGDEGELIQTCINAAAGPVHLDL